MLVNNSISEDFATFNMELANLVKSGLPLSEGLRHISKEVRSSGFKKEILEIQRRLERGNSLSDALSASPGFFSPYYITLIKAGEEGGNLSEVLYHLTRYAQFQYRTMMRIRSSLAYPVFVSILAIAIVCCICAFVVPEFEKIYEGLGGSLPNLTQLLVNFSYLIRFHTFSLIGGIIGAYIFIYLLIKYVLRIIWDKIKLRIHIFGKLFVWQILIHYCEVVGFLLKQKINMVDALRLASITTDNAYAASIFENLAVNVENGHRLSVEMEKHNIFSPTLSWMVETAEKQERVDSILMESASHYMERLDDYSERFSGIIEPLLVVCLGFIIGSIIIALYLPMFKIGDVIK